MFFLVTVHARKELDNVLYAHTPIMSVLPALYLILNDHPVSTYPLLLKLANLPHVLMSFNGTH